MDNPFAKYSIRVKDKGKTIAYNHGVIFFADEAFALFKESFNTHYGRIHEDQNLVSIHTGGWSENEELVMQFKETYWWQRNHTATVRGGHYYFNTDTAGGTKHWDIIGIEKN